MAADQYCLKWNNHQSTLLVQFETLLESDSLTDCTLSAEGKYLNVHKVLLSACSPYFSKLLGEHKDKHPIFFMKDVAFEELKGIVEYMYKGEVNIMQERLDSFLKTASSLQIKGLADQDGGKGEDLESDPGGGRVKRKQAPDLRGGYGEQSPMPEEPRSPKRRRRPRPVSQDDSLPPQDQNHCDTTTSAPAYAQQQQQEVVMPTPLVPVKKTEPVDNSMMNLKTEIPDDVPQVDVQDLTLDDDEDFNNDDITQPGTSFSETSQDFAQWQQQMATQSGADESFMAATQGINQSGSQGSYLVIRPTDSHGYYKLISMNQDMLSSIIDPTPVNSETNDEEIYDTNDEPSIHYIGDHEYTTINQAPDDGNHDEEEVIEEQVIEEELDEDCDDDDDVSGNNYIKRIKDKKMHDIPTEKRGAKEVEIKIRKKRFRGPGKRPKPHLTCDNCQAKFMFSTSYITHKKTKCPFNYKRIKCPYRGCHVRPRPYYGFIRHHILNKHDDHADALEIAEALKPPPDLPDSSDESTIRVMGVSCDQCGKMYKNRQVLMVHKYKDCGRPKIFYCPFPPCTKGPFRRLDDLRRHCTNLHLEQTGSSASLDGLNITVPNT